MSDAYKMAILRAIGSDATTGAPIRLKFDSLIRTLNLSKADLEGFLAELNKERFISQYAKKGVDGFTFILNQKGLDAAQDESFI
ncbi:MAG: hypothetical protein ABI687_10145 [Flavitalea sp.]